MYTSDLIADRIFWYSVQYLGLELFYNLATQGEGVSRRPMTHGDCLLLSMCLGTFSFCTVEPCFISGSSCRTESWSNASLRVSPSIVVEELLYCTHTHFRVVYVEWCQPSTLPVPSIRWNSPTQQKVTVVAIQLAFIAFVVEIRRGTSTRPLVVELLITITEQQISQLDHDIQCDFTVVNVRTGRICSWHDRWRNLHHQLLTWQQVIW